MEAVLDNRLALAAIVIIGVPSVVIGYIALAERILHGLRPRTAIRIRPWIWALPALAFVTVFLIYPAIATLIRSLFDRSGRHFIGVENFFWFLTSEDSLISLRNNALWAIVLPALVVGIGLAVAVLADRVRYEVVVRTIIFLPMAISSVAAGVIWRLMYDVDPDVGTLNAIIAGLGGNPVAWLSNIPWNNIMLIIVGMWMMTGLAVVILSAGVKGVPAELLEAARLDGASEARVFRHVVFPLLQPTIAVVATTVVIFALKTFDVVYVMTNGNFDTNVIANQMYHELFSYGQQARAATLATVLFIATAPIMIMNIRRFRQQEGNR